MFEYFAQYLKSNICFLLYKCAFKFIDQSLIFSLTNETTEKVEELIQH